MPPTVQPPEDDTPGIAVTSSLTGTDDMPDLVPAQSYEVPTQTPSDILPYMTNHSDSFPSQAEQSSTIFQDVLHEIPQEMHTVIQAASPSPDTITANGVNAGQHPMLSTSTDLATAHHIWNMSPPELATLDTVFFGIMPDMPEEATEPVISSPSPQDVTQPDLATAAESMIYAESAAIENGDIQEYTPTPPPAFPSPYMTSFLETMGLITFVNPGTLWWGPASGTPLNYLRTRHLFRPRLDAVAFVNALEHVDVSTIAANDMKCPHCWLPFGTTDDDDPSDTYSPELAEDPVLFARAAAFRELPHYEKASNDPVRTPCGHLFGKSCLIDILEKMAPICPMCRQDLRKMTPDSVK